MPSSTTAAEGKRDDTRSQKPVEEHVRVDHIAVCICTYRRPAELTKLLSEIEKQQTRGSFTFSVVVVDNDAAESAKAVVEAFAAGSSVRVEYYCERTQNISLARNRAVMNATGEYVALIDDDEWPGAQWLLNSYEAARRYKADGVLGPVRPCFEHDPPQWVVRGRFHEKPRHKPPQTGAVLKWNETRTSNVLLKRDVFGDGADLFDPRFGLGGGEDVEFFGRMIAKGRVFVWCQEAHVVELIPAERCTRKDMLRRALLRGRMSLLLPTAGLRDSIKSVLALSLYSVSLPVLFLLGHHLFMTYLVKCCDHLGKLITMCRLRLIKERYVTNR
jgi:succinoglycan biosynthesis protein ExoM